MKIILSRKGLDSSINNLSNLLLNEKDLIVIPILEQGGKTKYKDLHLKQLDNIFNNPSYSKALSPNTLCHADPNLTNLFNDKNFVGSLGQVDTAQTHLENQNVGIGDLFIFFGVFTMGNEKDNKIEIDNMLYRKHIMFGYLQIGDIIYPNQITQQQKLEYEKKYPWLVSNPHWNTDLYKSKNNCIYVARNYSTFSNKLKGYGMFNYKEKLVLTKENEIRPSVWDLPKALVGCEMSYHTKDNYKSYGFQSATRGQEFVIQDNKLIEKWAIKLIKKYSKRN